MGKFMSLKVTLSNKLVLANRTGKWSLTCVSAHMGFKIPSLRKLLQTTLVRTQENLLLIFWSRNLLNKLCLFCQLRVPLTKFFKLLLLCIGLAIDLALI